MINIIRPMTETTIPTIKANHKTTKAYWYKMFCDNSQTNLCLFLYEFLMSWAEAWTSQYPKGGKSMFPNGRGLEKIEEVNTTQ